MLATARLPGPNAEGCTEEDTIPPWQDCALGSAAAGATAIPTPIAPAATATTSFLVRFTNSPPFRGSSPRDDPLPSSEHRRGDVPDRAETREPLPAFQDRRQ